MGKRVDILESKHWKAGEDKTHRITVVDDQGASVDMGAFTLAYDLKHDIKDRIAAAIVTVVPTTDSVGSGTNNRALCALADTDTDGLDGWYWYVLRRTDNGSEGMLAFGKVPIFDVGMKA